MRRVRIAVATGLVALFGVAFLGGSHSEAAIHEIVASYCSGGDVGVIDADGFLEPVPLNDFGGTTPSAGHATAKPVVASGAVDVDTLQVTDKPNVKYEDGTSVFALSSSTADHPSADHCPKNALP